MDKIYNPVNNTYENINTKDGQKLIVCYQLAQQWREDTETPFDYIQNDNGQQYKIHDKMGRDILKEKERIMMGGGGKVSKLIKKEIKNDEFSLKTESIKSDSLKTESILSL